MKIVVLNESFLEPEHFEQLRQLGKVTAYSDTTGRDQALERLHGADVVVGDVNFTKFDRQFFQAAAGVKLLVVNSTGYDSVDLQAARDHHVLVANTPNFSTQAVAEYTFALILSLVRSVPLGDQRMKRHLSEIDPADPADAAFEGFELNGKTLGVIGFGAIGRRVAELGQALGMHVIAHNRTPFTHEFVKSVAVDDLLQSSDVVSLHSALAADNTGLLDETKLALMKRGAVLINTARAGLINTAALHDSLKHHRLRGAALDVNGTDPVSQDLARLPNVITTPHVAFFTREAVRNMADIIVDNVAAYAAGKPKNIVNGSKS